MHSTIVSPLQHCNESLHSNSSSATPSVGTANHVGLVPDTKVCGRQHDAVLGYRCNSSALCWQFHVCRPANTMDAVGFTVIIDDIVLPDGRTCMEQLGGGGESRCSG
jgi:hypothetical protein